MRSTIKSNHQRRLILNSLLLFVLLLIQTVGHVVAQTSLDGVIPSGMKSGSPAGSYESSMDAINLFNGNLTFRLPLLTVGGRGDAAFPLVFLLNPKWTVTREARPGQPALLYPFYTRNEAGFRGFVAPVIRESPLGFFRLSIKQAGSRDFTNRCPGLGFVHRETLTIIRFVGPDGTSYELRDKLTNGQPDSTSCTPLNRGKVFVTADGISVTFVSDTDIFDYLGDNPGDFPPSGYLLMSNGTRFRMENGACIWMRDRNGNKVSFSYSSTVAGYLTGITDSLGRQVSLSENERTISFKGFGGAPRTIRINSTSLGGALRSGFSLRTEKDLFPQLNDASENLVVNPSVVSSITLPNTQQYKFYYNSYAELARVELPAGGAIEYDYAPGLTDGPESGYLYLGVVGGHQIYRRVIERRVYPDGGSGDSFAMRTTYSRPESSASNIGYVQTDQYDSTGAILGSQRHYFYGSARNSFGKQPTQYSPWQEGLEYQTEDLDILRGVALRRVTHTWSQPVAGSHWPLTQAETQSDAKPNDPHITQTVTTWLDVTPNLVSKETLAYDEYNNRTNIYEHDLGAGAPGPLIRRTQTTYLTTNGNQGDVNYATDLNIHIRNLPVQQVVYDASGNVRSQTDFIYDNYGGDYPLVDRPGIVQHDDGFHTGYGARGNLTEVIRRNPGGSPSEIHLKNQYDIAGNLVKVIDGRTPAGITTFDFIDCFGLPGDDAQSNAGAPELADGVSYAFPTKVTNALGHTAYTKYDYYLGKPVNSEDANGVVSSVEYNDALGRPTRGIQARYVVGVGVPAVRRQTTTTYDDANRVITTTSDLSGFNDNMLTGKSYYDGLGRTWRGASYEGSTWSITDTQFDALGRISQVSNPYRAADPGSASPPPSLWTMTAYDTLSRVIQVTTPDGAHVDTTYNGNQVTVTDQAGKSRRSETNALGRLIKVTEDPGGLLNFDTYYSYDALDNLRQVTQGSQTRTFDYDSLSRLTSATNPENGTISYAYDANGNLIEKTDARGVKTTMTYDALNRVKSKVYAGTPQGGTEVANATPTVNYVYDDYSTLPGGGPTWPTWSCGGQTLPNTPVKGRLIGVTYGTGSDGTYYRYDASGKIIGNLQRMGTPNFVTRYTYDLAGAVLEECRGYSSSTRASVRNISAYDDAGRLTDMRTSFTPHTSSKYLVQGISYTPFGALQTEKYGNGLIHSIGYNNRLQPTEIRLGRPDNLESVFTIYNLYGTAANPNVQDPEITPAQNNGNIARIKYVISGELQYSQTFQYDPLNRLKYAVEHKNGVYNNAEPAWVQAFEYDFAGNRGVNTLNTSDNVDGGNSALRLDEFSEANNRITRPGYSYDAAGNLTQEPGKRYTYDAENRLVTAEVVLGATSQYVYDGNGKRVKKTVSGVGTRSEYGVGGELIAERNDAGVVTNWYYYRNGELLATSVNGTTHKYAASDHLGSPRAWTDDSGALIAGGRHDYLPFGEELSAGVGIRTAALGYGADSTRQKFTGKQRDDETGLDYFGERYYASTQGRFMACDPLMASAKTGDPQSWNRYVYVLNNPLRYIDPDGMMQQDAWNQLTEEERMIIAGKLHRQKKETNQQAFNRIMGEGNATAEQIATKVILVKNLIDSAGGHTNSAVWQQIKTVDGAWVDNKGGGGVTLHVNNRDTFLETLRNNGFDVNAKYEAVAKQVDGAHPNDSARQITETSLQTGMHLANDDSNDLNKFFVHWDRRSAAFRKSGSWQYSLLPGLERADAGSTHKNPFPAGEMREKLRREGIVPRNEP